MARNNKRKNNHKEVTQAIKARHNRCKDTIRKEIVRRVRDYGVRNYGEVSDAVDIVFAILSGGVKIDTYVDRPEWQEAAIYVARKMNHAAWKNAVISDEDYACESFSSVDDIDDWCADMFIIVLVLIGLAVVAAALSFLAFFLLKPVSACNIVSGVYGSVCDAQGNDDYGTMCPATMF